VLATKVLAILWGLRLAWTVRAVVEVLNESAYLFLAILNLSFIAIFVLPMQSMIADNPTPLLLLQVLGTFELCNATTAFLLAPKFYRLYTSGDLELTVMETVRVQTCRKFSIRLENQLRRSSRASDQTVSARRTSPIPTPDLLRRSLESLDTNLARSFEPRLSRQASGEPMWTSTSTPRLPGLASAIGSFNAGQSTSFSHRRSSVSDECTGGMCMPRVDSGTKLDDMVSGKWTVGGDEVSSIRANPWAVARAPSSIDVTDDGTPASCSEGRSDSRRLRQAAAPATSADGKGSNC